MTGTAIAFALFDTAIGCCAVAWSPRGIAAVRLPEGGPAASRERLTRRFPGAREAAPPPAAQRVIDGIVALLEGEPRALDDVALDMEGVPEFDRKVYEVARGIPWGGTLSYGEIARRLSDPAAARDVGRALGQNPFAIVVPCHRVVAADGTWGGFSARGGVATKRRLLSIESAQRSLIDD
ncbi:MAG TPA: methylated-DNA--[protein]-cysteine S-methyltransferase [Methylomirabilota bacterium]